VISKSKTIFEISLNGFNRKTKENAENQSALLAACDITDEWIPKIFDKILR
jgi:hypothetical protein